VDPPRPSTRISAADTPTAVAAARRVEPTGRLARLVRGDLDWVAMKALAKNRAERYESASGLARDVERYLAGEPVEAHPPSALYRARRFLRRNKGAVTAAAVCVLLLVAGAIVSAWQARVAKAERDRAIAAQESIRKTLTRQVARQMEADLLRLAAVGEALAATMEQGGDWSEQPLERWKRRLMANEPQIYGLSLSFEPETFDPRPLDHPERYPHRFPGVVPFAADAVDPGRDGYTLYVYRKPPDGTVTAESLGPKYQCRRRMVFPNSTAPHRPWYRDTLKGTRIGWTEPFFDQFGGDIPMVSYTAPIRRPADAKPIGVLTVDLSLDYFQRQSRLSDPIFGDASYGFVISRSGSLISHPHHRSVTAEDGEKAPDIRTVWPDPGFRDLISAALAIHGEEEVGQGACVDPATGRRSRFLYARFKPAGWVFVAVIPEDAK
jgi:hypothetical protein